MILSYSGIKNIRRSLTSGKIRSRSKRSVRRVTRSSRSKRRKRKVTRSSRSRKKKEVNRDSVYSNLISKYRIMNEMNAVNRIRSNMTAKPNVTHMPIRSTINTINTTSSSNNFNSIAQATTAGGIPKIIHQIWVGGEIDNLNKAYVNTCNKMEGWKHRLWGNADITPANFPRTLRFINKCRDNNLNILPKKHAQISDLMRLEILYNHGGVYLDTNIECLKNLDKMLHNKSYSFVVSNENDCGFDCSLEDNYYISNSFIASTKGNEIINYMLGKLWQVDFKSTRVNIQTGPYFLGKHIRYLRSLNALKYNVVMLPREYIYPFKLENLDNYSSDEEDECLSFEPREGFKEYSGKNGKIYIKIPCTEYPCSYTIKHWYTGGSWI